MHKFILQIQIIRPIKAKTAEKVVTFRCNYCGTNIILSQNECIYVIDSFVNCEVYSVIISNDMILLNGCLL